MISTIRNIQNNILIFKILKKIILYFMIISIIIEFDNQIQYNQVRNWLYYK